ncbi:hypothetical protein Tco_1171383 [Tanacetum coccineum]
MSRLTSSSFILTSPEESELKLIRFHRELILPSLPPLKFQVAILLPLLLLERRFVHGNVKVFLVGPICMENVNRICYKEEKIIVLLATYLHQTSKPLSRPQEVEEIKEKEDKFQDFKKDLTVSLDSTESSILPPPLLDSDSPFTAELSASVTLNSLRNEDKVFKPGILVYHAIHDKNLVTLEENLKENISSGTLLVFKEPSFLLPPPKPPDECLKNVVLNDNFYQSKKTLSLNVEDVNSFTFIIWIFLPYFTYTKESPLIFSFRSENFVFDPGIVTFHKPVAFLMKVFYLLSLRTN